MATYRTLKQRGRTSFPTIAEAIPFADRELVTAIARMNS
jgi:hypothetical protein